MKDRQPSHWLVGVNYEALSSVPAEPAPDSSHSLFEGSVANSSGEPSSSTLGATSLRWWGLSAVPSTPMRRSSTLGSTIH